MHINVLGAGNTQIFPVVKRGDIGPIFASDQYGSPIMPIKS
jgi:hypothetical protein